MKKIEDRIIDRDLHEWLKKPVSICRKRSLGYKIWIKKGGGWKFFNQTNSTSTKNLLVQHAKCIKGVKGISIEREILRERR